VFWDRFTNRSLFFVNFIATVTYISIIFLSASGRSFDQPRLIGLVLGYNLFFVAAYNVLFFLDHGNFLAFQSADSATYKYIAEHIARRFIKDTLSSFPWYIGNDDKGFVVYASLLYRIIPSNLTLNFFNILLNLATTILIYRLGKFFLSRKGAFLAALIFGLATYTVFYQASGLKETLMVFLTVGAFYYLVQSSEEGSFLLFVLGLLFCVLLTFFRVPITYFLFISAGVYLFFKRKKGSMLGPLVLILSVVIGILFYVLFQKYLPHYTRSFVDVLTYKETVLESDIRFAGAVSVVSGFFGPFPTLIPFPGKENISIFAGSLILKVFISAYFVVGAYFCCKTRSAIAIGLTVFCLLEIGGLCYLLETLELRKGFPHMGFFVLLAVYGFENLEKWGSQYKGMKRIALTGNLGFAGAIFAWNILRF
jgi:4-amino-4-deoxy-L-arabinose transferase-like glycosyltransferase